MVSKIKVLQFICPAGFYGAEMWIMALAKSLDTAQVDCSLAVTRESEGQNMELYKRFSALGLPAYQIPMQGRFDLSGIFKLKHLIREQGIEIIHTHGYKSDIIGLLVAKLAGIKCVSTPHGFENAPDLKLQFFIWLGCRSLRYFDAVAPLSEGLCADIERIGVAKDRVTFIRNGVDLDEVRTLETTNTKQIKRQPGEKIIGYVGQLIRRKNISAMLATFDALYSEHKNVRLVLIGDGSHRTELEQEARALISGEKIDFLGYRKDRLALVKEMDLFCMTSSLEGIPRCMMEAMALEIPVAAFRIPGVDQLVEDGKTGLLAEFDDVRGLQLCWEKLLFDEDFSRHIAYSGRRRIEKMFSGERMAEDYRLLYQKIIQ